MFRLSLAGDFCARASPFLARDHEGIDGWAMSMVNESCGTNLRLVKET